MSERLSIVIPSEMNEDIEKLQEILKMDKSTLIRHLLSNSIKETKLNTMLEEYRIGKLSLGKAAELSGTNLWEFIDQCRAHGIQLDLTEEEAIAGIEKVKGFNLVDYKKKAAEKLRKLED